MLLWEVDYDSEHQDHLDRTGFWGKRAAGCLIYSIKSNKFLFSLRSRQVEQPNTYGGYGGAIDGDEETPKEAVLREVHEEAGYHGEIIGMLPMFVFRVPEVFEYHNFLVIVENEFEPELNWESSGFEWVKFGNWPRPLHPGMIKLLNDGKSIAIMKKVMEKYHGDTAYT